MDWTYASSITVCHEANRGTEMNNATLFLTENNQTPKYTIQDGHLIVRCPAPGPETLETIYAPGTWTRVFTRNPM
jgi:hypothetical protein